MSLSRGEVSRLVLFAGLLSLSTGYWYCRIDAIRAEYQESMKKPQGTELGSQQTNAILPDMRKQNELLTNWGVIALGGLIALTVTTKVHPISRLEWIYLLFVPAASLLLGSLWASVVFQRRLTYLALKGIASVESLNKLLTAQSDFLQLGILILGLFTGIFLLNIVLGKVTPANEE